MLARIPRSTITVLVLAIFINVWATLPAYAFLGVADTGDGVLAAILAQGADALATTKNISDDMNTVREFGKRSFALAKDAHQLATESAQMVEGALHVGQGLRNFSFSRFGTAFTDDMATAFPDIGYWQNAAAHPLGHGLAGDAQILSAMKACLADYINTKDACQRLAGRSERERIDAMLTVTFGVRPSSQLPAAQTQAEFAERTCDDKYLEASRDVALLRPRADKLAADFSALRQKCETSLQATATKTQQQRTWGVFQGIANKVKSVQNDLAAFKPADASKKPDPSDDALLNPVPVPVPADSEAAKTASAAAKAQSDACAEAVKMESLVNAEFTAIKNRVDLVLQDLALCRQGQEILSRQENKKRTQEVQSNAAVNTRKRALAAARPALPLPPTPVGSGVGYNIFADQLPASAPTGGK